MNYNMDKNEIIFSDPYFKSNSISDINGLKISYPVVDNEDLVNIIKELKSKSKDFYLSRSMSEIQTSLDKIDNYFSDTDKPEIQELINMISISSGYSKFDIERYGLGIFPLLFNYDRDRRSYYIEQAIKSSRIIETENGYLLKIGGPNFPRRWKEPELLSHFISGNVVGYTAILSRIGLPVKQAGAAQILKLPSASSFFPLVYLDKLS